MYWKQETRKSVVVSAEKELSSFGTGTRGEYLIESGSQSLDFGGEMVPFLSTKEIVCEELENYTDEDLTKQREGHRGGEESASGSHPRQGLVGSSQCDY